VSKKGGVPSQGRSAAGEEGGVQGMQGGESYHKELRQLLKVEGRGIEKEAERVEGDKGKGKERGKSGEAHNATSERSLDESWIRKD